MTNLGGLWILFLLLSLLLACLAVTVLLVAVLAWIRRGDGERRQSALRLGTGVATAAIGLSILSWLAAFAFVTPAGIVERLGRPNFVLVVTLLGFTAPAVVGGYVLWSRRAAQYGGTTGDDP